MINIEQLRKQNKLSQEEFCKIIGIAQGNYNRLIKNIESGKSPNISIALNLSEHFGLSLDEIYGITKEEQQAGIHATVKIDITPLEDNLLDVFREIGEKLGEPSQRAFIEIGKSILEKIS